MLTMTVPSSIVLFSLRSLLQLEVLVWLVGVPVLVIALVILALQYRQHKALKFDLKLLSKVKVHSVEYDLVLNVMKVAIWRLDVSTRVFSFDTDYRDNNDSVVIPPGTKLDDVIDHVAPEYQDMVRSGYDDLLSGKIDVFHAQFQMQVPHTDRTYWSESFATIDKRDNQGNPLSVVGTLMRIDQQKEIESALMDAVYHAEESDRLKSAFLANISHEIRTPLNAIVGFSDVLPMVESDEERQNLINLIKQNNTQLLRIFDDIVSMSKLEARGAGELKKSTFELGQLFKELTDKYRLQADEKGLGIVVAQEEMLPMLTTDRDRVREILNQYLNNAIKFTTTGQVTLGCTEQEGKWRIYVQDTGKGIPQEMCNEHLFERFVKVDEFIPGTGLGLSICRSMALTLNGEVGVESKLNEGSTFWLDLDKA